jgi:DNA polymerase
MTPFQQHVKDWQDCELCGLCQKRKKVVLVRGSLPAPILFVGEAPGDSEDVKGVPFHGPAGQLLQAIIDRALQGQHKFAATNLVGCIPRNDNWDKREPHGQEIEACAPRLLEITYLVKPKLLVWVGDLSKKWGPKLLAPYIQNFQPATLHMMHPAAMMRIHVTQQALTIQKATVALADAVEEL